MAKTGSLARFVFAATLGLTLCAGGALAALGCGAGEPAARQESAGDATVTTPARDGGSGLDAATEPSSDGGTDASFPSRCSVTPEKVSCTHLVTRLDAGAASRDVYWQIPSTPPPAAGYPVVVVYQGSLGSPSLTWGELTPLTPFGGYQQGRLQAMLLDSGFTVVAPEATAGIAWQTNSGLPFDLTTDKTVIDELLVELGKGQFGPANMARLYATGISSGGYMTSRMAVSYAGTFRALAIQSGSYATCLGAACSVPALPANHPPTLFLHGQLDTTVPLFTAELYYDALVAKGIETKKTVDPALGHEWLPVAPEKITEWFTTH